MTATQTSAVSPRNAPELCMNPSPKDLPRPVYFPIIARSSVFSTLP